MIYAKNILKGSSYNFKDYFDRYENFIKNNFSILTEFWTTFENEIDPNIFRELRYLQDEYFNMIAAFEQLKKGKKTTIEYFDFVNILSDIKTGIDIIINLPKWLRTSINDVDIFEKPYKEYFVKEGDTFESIAKQFFGNMNKFNLIMDYNGISYTEANDSNWIGRKIKIPLFVTNTKKDLNGVIDGLVGENILGKDIDSNFNFVNDDIATKEGYECFKQSIINLLQKTEKGTIPEFSNIGNTVSDIIGRDLGILSFPMLKNNIVSLLKIEKTIEYSKINKTEQKDDKIEIDFSFTSVLGDNLDYSFRNS